MPAVRKASREQIIDAAVAVLRDDGFSAINARSVAKKLGCSTQPIYLSFSGMDELRAALVAECRKVQEDYIAREREETLFLRNSLGFMRFVYEKPRLFRFVYYENQFQDTPADRAFIDATVSGIMRAGGYSRAVAERFYYATWFFMYGIAVQMVYGFASPKWDDIRGLLLDQFGALKLYYSQYREEAQHE